MQISSLYATWKTPNEALDYSDTGALTQAALLLQDFYHFRARSDQDYPIRRRHPSIRSRVEPEITVT